MSLYPSISIFLFSFFLVYSIHFSHLFYLSFSCTVSHVIFTFRSIFFLLFFSLQFTSAFILFSLLYPFYNFYLIFVFVFHRQSPAFFSYLLSFSLHLFVLYIFFYTCSFISYPFFLLTLSALSSVSLPLVFHSVHSLFIFFFLLPLFFSSLFFHLSTYIFPRLFLLPFPLSPLPLSPLILSIFSSPNFHNLTPFLFISSYVIFFSSTFFSTHSIFIFFQG